MIVAEMTAVELLSLILFAFVIVFSSRQMYDAVQSAGFSDIKRKIAIGILFGGLFGIPSFIAIMAIQPR